MEHIRQTIGHRISTLLRRTDIQRRFIVAFLLLSLSPVLVIGIAAYRLSAESLNTRVGQTAMETARLLKNNVLSELSPVTSYFNSFSTNEAIQQILVESGNEEAVDIGGAARSIKGTLDDSPLHSPYFRNIQLIDRNGVILYDFIYAEPQNAKLSDRLASIDRTSPNDSIQFSGAGTILYGRKLHNLYGQNEPIGYLLCYLDEGIVGDDAFADISFGPDSKLVLLSVHDKTVIGSTDKTILGQSDAASILSERIGASDGTSFSIQISSKRYLVAYSHLERLDSYVVALIPDAYVTKDIAHIKESLFWTACLMIVISLALAMLIYTSILQPIKRMESYCRKIANDPRTLEERLDDTGGDELHVLSQTMDSMVGDIQHLMIRQEADEKRKRELELERLQYQINPHFLFNTLDTLSWIAEANEVPTLTEGLSALSRLLRNTLVETKEYIPLHQELEILRNYVAIQRIRYAENFEMTWHVEEGLAECRVPRFILQPLVENAIIHGTYDTGRIVTIDVSAKQNGRTLILKIADDGKGFEPQVGDTPSSDPQRYWGIGLQNVFERLKLHYGNAAGLTIESSPGRGTVCTIRLPFEKEGS